MNTKVIYTVITGEYDTLKEPLIITPGWDYVCFTDNHSLVSEHWTMRYVPKLNKSTAKKQSRALKIHTPVFETHDESIYIDANIQINCNLNKFLLKYNPSDIMVMDHPQRDNIYKEVLACVELEKDNPKVLLKQLDHYFSSGFDIFHSGLYSCGFIYRVHRDNIKRLSEDWASEVMKFSHRDQVSFPFVLSMHLDVVISTAPFSILKNEFLKTKHDGSICNVV